MPAGPPIVGDFVVLEPARGEEPVGGEELSLITLLRLLDGLPSLHPATERSTSLDGEAVERDVIGREVGQRAHVSLEVATERLGEREDQVGREILDAGLARRRHRAPDGTRVVGAVHPGQHLLVEALRSEREPVDAGGGPRPSTLGSEVVRIGLDGDLRPRRRRKVPFDACQRARQAFPTEPGGRTATEVDGVHLAGWLLAEAGAELFFERAEVLGDRHVAAHRDGEVAVGAAARAEGDVNVDVTGHGAISPIVVLSEGKEPAPGTATAVRGYLSTWYEDWHTSPRNAGSPFGESVAASRRPRIPGG